MGKCDDGLIRYGVRSCRCYLLLKCMFGRSLKRQCRVVVLSLETSAAFSWVCAMKSLWSCPTLCDPMDCSLPDCFVRGILQARILEWVAMFSSRGSSWPRDWTQVFCISCTDRQILYQWHHLESPYWNFIVVKIEKQDKQILLDIL